MANNKALIAVILGALVTGSVEVFAGLEESMKISASGIKTQIYRQQIMAENVANISTAKTEDGLPYRRQIPVLQATKKGVRVATIIKDPRPFPEVYDPANPIADERGFVKMPNVAIPTEMIDMSYSGILLEANTNAYNVTKGMYQTALELVK